jgi:DNA-binding NarL/FixJ family response regulator
MTPHVLVVDDDTLYAESLSAVLEQDGRLDVVGQAGDGREAVELAHALLPDVVVMDIHMPVMDGLEATRSLCRSLPRTRIVLITSSDSADDRRNAARVGAHAFLRKGVGTDALVEATLAAGLETVTR